MVGIREAKTFHGELFGWELETTDMPPSESGGDVMQYTEIKNDSQPNGGMMAINPAWRDVPPHGMVYFAVADCDATASKAQGLGGQPIVPPRHPAGPFCRHSGSPGRRLFDYSDERTARLIRLRTTNGDADWRQCPRHTRADVAISKA